MLFNVEPLNYNNLPKELFAEIKWSYCLDKMTVDLTPTDGEAAKAWLDAKSGHYIGICFSDAHVKHLYQHLTEYILSKLGTEGSVHCEPTLVAALGKGKVDPTPKRGGKRKRVEPSAADDGGSPRKEPSPARSEASGKSN